jgi:hypothetical protein
MERKGEVSKRGHGTLWNSNDSWEYKLLAEIIRQAVEEYYNAHTDSVIFTRAEFFLFGPWLETYMDMTEVHADAIRRFIIRR